MALTWTEYDSRGMASRMKQFFVRGNVEYELCAEGGQYVIKRTERKNGHVVVMETARGYRRDTEDVWKSIASG
ncbi:hypothetical protein [Nonomuraea sp. NPDC049750]|uniref:hypothetical protein n=2 Tax=unclassified Nonomuraea TaxID=2593643 RepID=UPI0033C90CBC